MQNAGSSKIVKVVPKTSIDAKKDVSETIEKEPIKVISDTNGKEPSEVISETGEKEPSVSIVSISAEDTEINGSASMDKEPSSNDEDIVNSTDSGICEEISDKSLDSSVVIIDDDVVEESSDPIQIKAEFKRNSFDKNRKSNTENLDKTTKPFQGSFEFLNNYFQKGDAFISTLKPSTVGDSSKERSQNKIKNSVVQQKEDTIFDMVKQRAVDITQQEPIASTSTAFPLNFNSTSTPAGALLVPLVRNTFFFFHFLRNIFFNFKFSFQTQKEFPKQTVSVPIPSKPSATRTSPRRKSQTIDLSDLELSPPPAKKSKSGDFLIVNILNDSVPHGYITGSQEKQIIDRLTSAIDNAMIYENVMPRFDECTFHDGYLMIVCADEFSKKWLQCKIPKLNPVWPNSKLRVVNAYFQETAKLTKFIVFIPGPKESVTNIFQRLCRMNPGLSTIGWRVHNRFKCEFGGKIVLAVDQISLANLELINFQPYYGLTRLFFSQTK